MAKLRPCDSTTPSVPVPSLPRIKRTRASAAAGEVDARPEPRIAELQAPGLTWIHLDAPTQEEAALLAERFSWHPLDLEDVLSKRQRPKVDDYPEYLFVVLHFPFYDKAIQRLNAAELDVFLGPDFLITLPNVQLLPQDHQARALDAPPARAAHRALPARGARPLLRRHRRRGRADLGPARQLQGGRGRARGHERVGHLAPPERRPPHPHRLQRRPPAADPHHGRLRDERPLPGLRHRGRVLGDRRLHGREGDRARRVLP